MPTFKRRTEATIAIKRMVGGSETNVLVVLITKASRRTFKLMEKDEITLVFSLATAVHFQVGDYVDDEIFGKYVIKEEQTPNYNKSTGGYDYQLVFVAPYYVWDNHEFTLTNASSHPEDVERQECSWHLTNDLKANVKEFIRCLDAIDEDMPASAPFSPFSHNGLPYVMHIHKTATHRDELSLMTYDSFGMLKSLKSIAETWHCEWWVNYEVPEKQDEDDWILTSDGDNVDLTEDVERGVIHFGKCEDVESAYLFNERPVQGVTDYISVEGMTAQRNDSKYANRLFILGGTRNLPESYRKTFVLYVEARAWDGQHLRHVYLPNRRLTEDMLDGVSFSTTETVTYNQPFDWATLSIRNENRKSTVSMQTPQWEFKKENMYTDVYLGDVKICVQFPTQVYQGWTIRGNAFIYRCVKDKPDALITDYLTAAGRYLFDMTYNPTSGEKYCIDDQFIHGGYHFTTPIKVDAETRSSIKVVIVLETNHDGLAVITEMTNYKTSIPGYATFSIETRTATNKIITMENGREVTYDVIFNPNNNQRPSTNPSEDNYYYYFALYKDGNGQAVSDNNYNSPIMHADPDPEQGQKFTLVGYNPVKIPLSWYSDDDLENPMSLVGLGERRLRLPVPTGDDEHDLSEDGVVRLCKDYVELDGISELVDESGRVEMTVKNDEIYPRCYLKVTEVTARQKMMKEELSDGSPRYWPYDLYYLKVTLLDGDEFPFDTSFANDEKLRALFISDIDEQKAYAEEGMEGQMPSGDNRFLLAGMEFDCEWSNADKTLTILTNQDYGARLPNDTLKPSVGDTIVLTGWDVRAMEYLGLVDKAEQRLWKFACDYLEAMKAGQFTFNCDMMSDWPKRIHDDERKGLHLMEGVSKMLLPLEGSNACVYNKSLPDGSMLSRVLGYEFKLDYPFDTPRYIIGETEAYSRIRELERNVTKAGSGGGSGSVSNSGVATGGGGGSINLVTGDTGVESLSELTDTSISKPAKDDLLTWNGTKWVNNGPFKEILFIDYWQPSGSILLLYNKYVWDGNTLYYYRQELVGSAFIAVEDIIPLDLKTLYIDKQHNKPYRWDGSEMQPLGGNMEISVDGRVITIGDTSLNFAHGHDWGDIVNKPNLVEGITAGNGKLSFLHSNGDTTVADFSSLLTAISGKASQTSVNTLEIKLNNLVNQRGMVIDPYVWASTYNPDGETWEEEIGEYWYDTSEGKLKILSGFILGVPQFPYVLGTFLLWHADDEELCLYTYYGSGTPTLITIFTQ